MNEAKLTEKAGRYKIQLGELDQETVAAVREAIELFNRCRRGGLVDALVALTVIDRARGNLAGHVTLTLEIHTGGGLTPNVDWRESLTIAPMSKRNLYRLDEEREAEAYRKLAQGGKQ